MSSVEDEEVEKEMKWKRWRRGAAQESSQQGSGGGRKHLGKYGCMGVWRCQGDNRRL